MENLESEVRELKRRLNDLEIKLIEHKSCITVKHMCDRVAELDESAQWKNFVRNSGVVDNIQSILNECYASYINYIVEELSADAQKILGTFKSKEWFEFQFCVIQKLLDPKNFDEEEDFGDTAGGCDEVAWDAGIDVITNMTSFDTSLK
jgi:hypothetical protein